jgi:hypothetical protein
VAGERIEAGVGGNPIKPCAKRSLLEAIEAAPGAQECLLRYVLGLVQGAEHAIAMQFDVAAVRFSAPFERLVRPRRGLRLVCLFRCFHHHE